MGYDKWTKLKCNRIQSDQIKLNRIVCVFFLKWMILNALKQAFNIQQKKVYIETIFALHKPSTTLLIRKKQNVHIHTVNVYAGTRTKWLNRVYTHTHTHEMPCIQESADLMKQQ